MPDRQRLGPASPEMCSEIAHRLRSTIGELVRSTRSVDRMSPVAAGVLDLLRQHGPLPTADLAMRRKVRHQTMAASVTELVEAGYVEVGPHPVDGRKKLNAITPAGRTALSEDAEQRETVLAAALTRSLSARELAALAKGLEALDVVVAELQRREVGRSGKAGQFVTGGW